MSGFDHLKATYFEECAELLDAAHGHLGAMADGTGDDETVHAIFRAIHSIKGGGGAFGFDRMVVFAHALESVLDLLRDDRLPLTAEITGLLIRSTDILADLIDAAQGAAGRPAGLEAETLAMLRETAAISETSHVAVPSKSADASPAPRRLLHIRMVPHADLFRNANEPLLLIRELKRLGPVTAHADTTRLPELDAMDPETAYLAWDFKLETTAPQPAVSDVFDFVSDCCDLVITEAPGASVGGDSPVGPAEADTSERPPAPTTPIARSPAAAPSIRVDVEKVDRLVNLVGELVINQAMLAQLGGTLPPDLCAGLLSGLATMSQHLRELQEGVMAVRAQPVKSVFSRMPRLVRELSAVLGKEVRLLLTGEATEIDKTVIEQLADPLTHMLRNALDHGIERPDERVAAGKSRHGTIHLGAEHRGGRILIEMSDDGHGIARDRVLTKARSLGLIAADSVPTDDEIDNLIFAPGFSTADTISDISGRGVGMDVVKRNILALGGRVTVSSRPGLGTRFSLSLPLTLAILDGMVVAVGRECYIIPVGHIVESLRPKPTNIHAVAGHGDVLAIRGEYLPLDYVHRRFAVQDAVTDPCQGIVMIVEGEGGVRVGLVIDELICQQQVVVKSLEANYGPVDGIGGATILGDGRVALILDVSRFGGNAGKVGPGERLRPSQPSATELH